MAVIYELELRHRAKPEEPIEERHRRFVEVLARYDPPLGYRGRPPPELPQAGELSTVVRLRALSTRGGRSYMVYPLRSAKYLRDDAQYDDSVFIRFDPQAVERELLFDQVFPAYVEAFGCYRALICDPESRLADWDHVVELCSATGKDVDGRDGVYRIPAAGFFDRELCRRAFGLAPEEIVQRLAGKVERAALLGDGALLVCSSRPLPREEYENIDARVRPLLK